MTELVVGAAAFFGSLLFCRLIRRVTTPPTVSPTWLAQHHYQSGRPKD